MYFYDSILISPLLLILLCLSVSLRGQKASVEVERLRRASCCHFKWILLGPLFPPSTEKKKLMWTSDKKKLFSSSSLLPFSLSSPSSFSL